MKVFAISDLHLSTAVKKPMNIFGDGWDNHFEKISADWESKVSDKDIVLLGGDMSWGMNIDEATPDYELVAKLKGKKIVVKGNHDYYWNSLSKMKASFPQFDFLQNNAFRYSDESNVDGDTTITENSCGVVVAGTRGWNIPSKDTADADKKIYARELMRLDLSLKSAKKLQKDGDKLIAMLHYPPFDADYGDTEMTQVLESYGVDYVLYGHLHGKNVRVTPMLTKNNVKYILTSCDLINNKLVNVCEV